MTDLAAWLSGRRVVLVSPHPDDVAYSIGGIVAAAAGLADCTLLSVFGRSRWALSAALRARGEAAVTCARGAEDRAFAAMHGLAHRTLDLGDTSCRGHDASVERTLDPADDPQAGAVAAAIRAAIEALAPDLVIAPLAIGGHVDHRIVRDAVVALRGVERGYYEDVPYAAWQALETIEHAAAADGLRPRVTHTIADGLAAKIAGMWLYATQTDSGTIDEMRLHAERLGTGGAGHAERIWA